VTTQGYPGGKKPRSELQAAMRRLTVATVMLYVMAVGIAVGGGYFAQVQRDQLKRETHRTTTALCALRGDLERRVEDSRRFLEENPHGIPGVTAASVRLSIQNQEKTIGTLSIVECP
jgi:uncharacterized protein HemX